MVVVVFFLVEKLCQLRAGKGSLFREMNDSSWTQRHRGCTRG